MKTSILVIAVLYGCAENPPPTADTSQAAISYCTDGGGRIECFPNSNSQSDAWCDANCRGLSGAESGYCPEYNSVEIRYCQQHCFTDTVNCDTFCQPAFEHQCIAGFRP